MPWGLAAGALTAAGGIYAADKAGDTAKDARRATTATAREEAARQEEATARARAGLQPYADQEGMARNQMMAQLGLAPPPGAGGATMGGGMIPMGSPQVAGQDGARGSEGVEFQRFMENMLGDQIAIAQRAGYSRDKAVAEGARRAEGFLQSLKQSGDLPGDYTTPSLNELVDYGHEMGAQNQYAFKGSYGINPETGKGIQGTGPESLEVIRSQLGKFGGAEKLLPQYFGGGEAGQPGAMMGEQAPGGVGGPGGPQNIQSIMQRAGADGLPEGMQGQFYEDLQNPNFAMGMGYESNPAYQKMIDETMTNVNQYAANAGGLYSGARGEALREASAATQMNFQRDLANRQEADLNRRGTAVNNNQSREDSYYTNYMNMLQNLSNPTTATNIANLEAGNAANVSNINSQATADANRARYEGTAAENAGLADVTAGIGSMAGAWMNRPNPQTGNAEYDVVNGNRQYAGPPAP